MKSNKNCKEISESKKMMVSALKLPKDLLLGAVILTVTGKNEAYVENYKGIILYTDTLIKLQTKTCKVLVMGKKLHIEYFTNDEMKIVGEIEEIKYES